MYDSLFRLLAGTGDEGDNGTLPSNSTSANGCAVDESNKDFDQISFVIAIALAVLAAVSNNLGVNLQKLAWTKKQKGSSSVAKYRIIWVCGMAGIVLASVFDFVALAFGPQSVIAPLGALTMVMNACVAPWMHGERLPRVVFLATFIIVGGCAMAVATASHENIICNLDGIFSFFLTPQSIVYFILVTIITVVVVGFIRYAERILEEYKTDSDEYQKIFKLHRISYAFVAGLLGAQSVVFARSVGMMFQATARGEQIFLARVQTYGILLGLIVSIAIQLAYLNKGLARFESTYNVPVFTGTFIVSVAISGGVVYNEFNEFSAVQGVLFPLGVLMCIFGVGLLARGGSALPDEVSAATDDVEDRNVDSFTLKEMEKQHNNNSLVTMADIKEFNNADMEMAAGVDNPMAQMSSSVGASRSSQKQTHPTSLNTTIGTSAGLSRESRVGSSLRIRSGGFIPFVIEENSRRRTNSSMSRPRARTDTAPSVNATLKPNWLLGIRIDEEEDYVREGSTPSY